MIRRTLLKLGMLSGAVAASGLAAPAIAQGKRTLKMVTTWPKNFPGLGTGAQRLADSIGEMTDGQIDVTLYAAGELVPAFESYDAVSSGTADMYHGADYYWQGKHKGFNFFTSVPFGMTADEISAWIQWGGGQELWNELAGRFNVRSYMGGNTGVQMGGWFRKEINSLDDMQGLKIRMPGLGGEVLRRIGAAAVAMPGGEIFPAMQSGAIDASEWVGPWNDLAFGFYKVAKYYYYPGFHEPGSVLSCGMNLDVFNSLSKAHQAVFQAACHQETNRMLAEFNRNNGDALATLINEHGVELRRVPNEVLTTIGEISGQVVHEVSQEDDLGKEIYESFITNRRNSIGWSRLSEESYFSARRLPFPYEQ
ncbi:MAG: TRAP transporter substrate-binding protein [Pseudomonadota bacterium]